MKDCNNVNQKKVKQSKLTVSGSGERQFRGLALIFLRFFADIESDSSFGIEKNNECFLC